MGQQQIWGMTGKVEYSIYESQVCPSSSRNSGYHYWIPIWHTVSQGPERLSEWVKVTQPVKGKDKEPGSLPSKTNTFKDFRVPVSLIANSDWCVDKKGKAILILVWVEQNREDKSAMGGNYNTELR